jgi:hypothetical protein
MILSCWGVRSWERFSLVSALRQRWRESRSDLLVCLTRRSASSRRWTATIRSVSKGAKASSLRSSSSARFSRVPGTLTCRQGTVNFRSFGCDLLQIFLDLSQLSLAFLQFLVVHLLVGMLQEETARRAHGTKPDEWNSLRASDVGEDGDHHQHHPDRNDRPPGDHLPQRHKGSFHQFQAVLIQVLTMFRQFFDPLLDLNPPAKLGGQSPVLSSATFKFSCFRSASSNSILASISPNCWRQVSTSALACFQRRASSRAARAGPRRVFRFVR